MEVLRTLIDQAIYGRAHLSARSLAIWAEREPHNGRGADPILLKGSSGWSATAFPHTRRTCATFFNPFDGTLKILGQIAFMRPTPVLEGHDLRYRR